MSGQAPSASSYFAAPDWEPVCSVGSHGPGGMNAQICVSIFGASIVPDRPRLLVLLWKSNYTHDLVLESGSVAISLLAEDQHALLEPLGLRSGRDRADGRGKLDALNVGRTASGDPYFPGSVGYLDCRVLDTNDLEDSTCFVVSIRDEQRLSEDEPMTWARAQELAGDDFMRRYKEKFESDAAGARRTMLWQD